ncbi:MAG: secretin N-terminal domain-containing protein [Thermoguttaceae bacterium]
MRDNRSAMLMAAGWALLAALAAGQVPDPIRPTADAPARQPAGLPPAVVAGGVAPTALPGEVSPAGVPAMPESSPPFGAPGGPPTLPNLNAPFPGTTENPWLPPGQAAAGSQPAAGQPAANPILKLLDANGDGSLSADEVESAPTRLWQLDRNLDGRVSAEELALVLAPRWDERRRAVPGLAPAEAPQPQSPMTQPAASTLPELPTANERPRFEVYPLRGLDPSQALATLQQVLAGQPEARLTFDGRTGSILVLAPPSAHSKIREALAGLLEGERTGMPGFPPDASQPGAAGEVPVVPRVVPIYNARSSEVLRIIQQVYRDRVVEPSPEQAAGGRPMPGDPFGAAMQGPTVPAGKMVIGEGADPNTIVVSAQDDLFFEIVDLIERLDEAEQSPAETSEVRPPR